MTFATSIPIIKQLLKANWSYEHPSLTRVKMGLTFKNPIGLAAGFDKDGKYIHALSHLGFGFIEVGTVTPIPQAGNQLPRLFRLPEDEALINRMGFNNAGVDAMIDQLSKAKRNGLVIGGNIGKNKVTPNDQSLSDYDKCFTKLHDFVDYFVVNVSSPNTPGLRDLQEKEPLLALLSSLQKRNEDLDNPKPILLKIAPDLSWSQVDDVIDVIKASNLTGVIATNTTIDRSKVKARERISAIGAGGLSGLPLQKRSTEVIKYLRQNLGPNYIIIGVGGINSPQAAKEKIAAGADLIQVYSGLIFEGPTLIRRIAMALAKA